MRSRFNGEQFSQRDIDTIDIVEELLADEQVCWFHCLEF